MTTASVEKYSTSGAGLQLFPDVEIVPTTSHVEEHVQFHVPDRYESPTTVLNVDVWLTDPIKDKKITPVPDKYDIEVLALNQFNIDNSRDNDVETTSIDTHRSRFSMLGARIRNEQDELQLQIAQENFDKGIDYWTQSEMDLALQEFSRSLAIRETIRGRLDPETAKCYLWVGTIYFLQDQFERALDDFGRCFRIQHELASNGTKNKNACQVVSNWINKSLDAVKKDKDLYWKTFTSCLEYGQLGDMHMKKLEYKKAIESYRAAVQLEYFRRRMNPNWPGRPLADCGDFHFKIAQCYHLEGDLDGAWIQYSHAISIYDSRYGQTFCYTTETKQRMLEILIEMGHQYVFAENSVEAVLAAHRHEESGDWFLEIQNEPDLAVKEYEAALLVAETRTLRRKQATCDRLYHKLGRAFYLYRNRPQKQHDLQSQGKKSSNGSDSNTANLDRSLIHNTQNHNYKDMKMEPSKVLLASESDDWKESDRNSRRCDEQLDHGNADEHHDHGIAISCDIFETNSCLKSTNNTTLQDLSVPKQLVAEERILQTILFDHDNLDEGVEMIVFESCEESCGESDDEYYEEFCEDEGVAISTSDDEYFA